MSAKLKKIRKLNREAWSLCKKDGPQALQLARQAEQMIAGCPQAESRDQFECFRTQTYCLDMLSKPEEALPIGLKAGQLAEQIADNYSIGSIQSILGRIYWHIDDYPTAMATYLKALSLVQTENHPDLEISLINGLGLVQYGLENYSESLAYFRTCLERAAPEDLTGRADANNNIAYVLHMLGRDEEAVEFASAGLTLFNQLGTSVGKMETLHSLGAIHFALGHHEQAMSFLREGLELSRRNDSPLLEISYVLEICRILQADGLVDEAEKDLLAALRRAERIGSLTNISLVHERLVGLYKRKGDFVSALEHLEAFHATYKRIFNDKADRRIKNLEILHQVEMTRKQADLYRGLADTDFLTGLMNRRRFLEIAEIDLGKVRTEHGQLALIMADIDHFKSVNDQYGHETGDKVLSVVASRIKKSLREVDVAGRYGGEEFLILVSNRPPELCVKIAERIRQAVAKQPIEINQNAIHVTISLGVAFLDPERVVSLQDLINCADQTLYQAKEQGRNRVVAWMAEADLEPREPAHP